MVIVILRQHRPRCRPSSARSAGSHSSAFMTRQLTPLSKNSETMTGYYDNMVIGSWNKMQICSIQDTSQKKCPNQTILMIFFPGVRWKFLRWAILGRCWRSWHSGPEILVGGTKVFDEKRWETIDEIFDFCKYCGWDIWYDVPVPVSPLKSLIDSCVLWLKPFYFWFRTIVCLLTTFGRAYHSRFSLCQHRQVNGNMRERALN